MASISLGDKIICRYSSVRDIIDYERMVIRYGKRKNKKISKIYRISRWLDRIRSAIFAR